MKILVTGINGQLGYDVCQELDSRYMEYQGASRKEFDLSDTEATYGYVMNYAPDVVIHCAAWTAVDQAEDAPDAATAVNVSGTRAIAQACKDLGAKMLYISTDYVFKGDGDRFYEPDDPTAPLGTYGMTKLGGEKAVRELLERYFIVRTSWVFGVHGNNFVKTMLRLAQTRNELNVVCDQIGSPTYTADLAPLLCDMAASEQYGIYHATNEGVCSWAEFAEEIFRVAGKQVKVNHIPTSEYHTRAVRPLNSRMSKDKLVEKGFYRLPAWQDAVRRYINACSSAFSGGRNG